MDQEALQVPNFVGFGWVIQPEFWLEVFSAWKLHKDTDREKKKKKEILVYISFLSSTLGLEEIPFTVTTLPTPLSTLTTNFSLFVFTYIQIP